MGGATTKVTAGGIRRGEPQALAGLCTRRGGAVLAYSEHVAAPGQAGQAAANAFARFRAGVTAADESGLDTEALLHSATRHAAAARGSRTSAGEYAEQSPDCPAQPLLVGWIEETLTAPERERFEEHVAGCSACVDAVARFEAAERAYEHPPKAPLPESIARLIVGALVAAAPVTALDGDVAAVREAVEKHFFGEALGPKEPRIPAAPTSITTSRPSPPSTPAAAALRRRPTRSSSARGQGAAMLGTAALVRHDRRVARRRHRRAVGMGRTKALGLTLSAVMLIGGIALFSSLDPSPSSGESASSVSGSLPPSAVDELESLQNQRLDALPRQREPGRARNTDKPKPGAPRSSSDRYARRARSRRAAHPRRQAAAPSSRTSARVAPSSPSRRATRATTTVAVINGTTISSVATRIAGKVQAGGFTRGSTGNNTNEQRATSRVLYTREARAEGREVGKLLHISEMRPIDAETLALAGGNADVVVIVGLDQATRATTTVAVFNGTTITGLASGIADKVQAGGFKRGSTGNDTNQQRATSLVLYTREARAEGREVGKLLHISKMRPIDAETQALAGGNADVVVIVGLDRAP